MQQCNRLGCELEWFLLVGSLDCRQRKHYLGAGQEAPEMANRDSLINSGPLKAADHHADHLATTVQQRPTRMTGIQRGVELNTVQFAVSVMPQGRYAAWEGVDCGI